MTTKRAYFQSRSRAAAGLAAIVLGCTAFAISVTTVGATVESPTSNWVANAGSSCADHLGGQPGSQLGPLTGTGAKSDASLTVTVGGIPSALDFTVDGTADKVRVIGVIVQGDLGAHWYYYGGGVPKGARGGGLTLDQGAAITSYTFCYDTEATAPGGNYGGEYGTTTTTDPSTTTTVPGTTTTVPQTTTTTVPGTTTTTVPQTTTTVPQTTTTVPQTTTTVPQTTTTFPFVTTTTVPQTTTTVPRTTTTVPQTTTSIAATTITSPSTTTTQGVSATTVTTLPTQVGGTQVSRSLPRTGLESMPLTEAGVVLIMIGLAFVASGRVRREAEA